MRITEEDYIEWKLHPVTEALFAVMRKEIVRMEQEWLEASFKNNLNDPEMLSELRSKTKAYMEIMGAEFEYIENSLEGK